MSVEFKIIALASDMDYDAIVVERSNLLIERMKMDKFFSMFLDKFEKKMSPEATDTPIWKLYKTKLKEYESIQRAIKLSDYYLKKVANV